MEENKKKLTILLIIISVLLVLLLIFSFLLGKKSNELPIETTKIIENVNVGEDILDSNVVEHDLTEVELQKVNLIASSRIEVPGADLITPDNQVITNEGELVRADVLPTESGAPTQTKSINREELSDEVIDIGVSLGAFSPNSFTVKAGEAVTISLTSTDEFGHSFVFRSPELQAIGIAVKGGETRAMSFNAPSEVGEYEFYCNVGGDKVGHVTRGEVGKMIVE